MPLFTVVRGVFGIFHLIVEFEEGVFDVIVAVWWGFAISRAADWRHGMEVR